MLITSEKNNKYLFNKERGEISYLHPLLFLFFIKCTQHDKQRLSLSKKIILKKLKEEGAFLKVFSQKDINYYYKKFLFQLKHHILHNETGIKKTISWKNFSAKNVEQSFFNVENIVFSATNKCNLQCKYCYQGPLYEHNTEQKKDLSFKTAQIFLKYFFDGVAKGKRTKKGLMISFYGGEPLLNINVIKKIVHYIEEKNIFNLRITWRLTTNGVLLKKHIEFLKQKDFKIDVSFDGDKKAQSLRVFKNEGESHSFISANLKFIKRKYPSFFKNNISFISILNANSTIPAIKAYFRKELQKPSTSIRIHEINQDTPIKNNSFFQEMFKSVPNERLKCWKDANGQVPLSEDPHGMRLFDFFKCFFRVEDSYKTLAQEGASSFNQSSLPTGTCVPPFKIKIFLSPDGSLFPCEKTCGNYFFGKVTNNHVSIDYEKIAKQCNLFFLRMKKQCNNCFFIPFCSQCAFIEKIFDNKKPCRFYKKNPQDVYEYQSAVSILEKFPHLYEPAMGERLL